MKNFYKETNPEITPKKTLTQPSIEPSPFLKSVKNTVLLRTVLKFEFYHLFVS